MCGEAVQGNSTAMNLTATLQYNNSANYMEEDPDLLDVWLTPPVTYPLHADWIGSGMTPPTPAPAPVSSYTVIDAIREMADGLLTSEPSP